MAEHRPNRRMSEVVGTHAGDHAVEPRQQPGFNRFTGSISSRLEQDKEAHDKWKNLRKDLVYFLI